MDKLKQTMTDKGYVGSVEFSDADGVFFGKVQGVRRVKRNTTAGCAH